MDSKAIASDQARFLRVQMEIPLNKPIRRGAPILSPEGDKVWVAFQYEHLVGLCFHYGLLGHEAKARIDVNGREGEESPYGKRLRAGFQKPKQSPGRTQPSRMRRQAKGDR